MTRRTLPILLAAIVLLCSAPAAWAAGATVPDVVGLAVDDARAMLEQAGFAAEIQTVPGRRVGLVLSQDPGGLASRAKGTSVRLQVVGPTGKVEEPPRVPVPEDVRPDPTPGTAPDLGAPPTGVPPTGPPPEAPPRQPQPVEPTPSRPPVDTPPAGSGGMPDMGPPPGGTPPTAPDGATAVGALPAGRLPDTQGPALPSVLGQPVQQATAALRQWRVNVEYTLGLPNLNGTVVNQDPFASSRLAPGEEVTLVVAVANLPSPQHGAVPQVVGQRWQDAARALAAGGYQAQPMAVPGRPDQVGRVLAQRPLPGSLAVPGATVRLWVGRGAGTGTMRPLEPAAPVRPDPFEQPAPPLRVPDDAPPAGMPGQPLPGPATPPREPAPRPPTQPGPPPPTQPEPAPQPPVQPGVNLAQAVLKTPPDAESYPFRYGADFSWDPVAGASAYEWELEEELPSGAWQRVDSRAFPGTHYRPERMSRGRYRWRVRAVHLVTKGPWSEYRRLFMY